MEHVDPRGVSARSKKLWCQVHRAAGYAFIALFAIFSYFMFLRMKGWSHELSPRLILHIGLALVMMPLLVVKLIVARHQKTARGLLAALGIGIFATAFTLVALNVSIHFLAFASREKLSAGTSAVFVIAMITSVTIAFFAKRKRPKPESDAEMLPVNKPTGQEPSNRNEPFILTLGRVEAQTCNAKTLRFLLLRGHRLATRPGQFLTFELLVDGKPLTRSYSISSSPTQASFVEITPKRVPNGYVSHFLNDQAKVGLTLKARGPYGKFCFDESQHQRIILIAGGSGITPMISILRYIDDLCIRTNPTLIYCVRTEQDVFFKNEFAALQARLSKFRYVLVLSQPSSEWTGWKGRLRREILEREIEEPLESTFFLCGPGGFMELARTLLKDMGVESSRILQESFRGGVGTVRDSTQGGGVLKVKFVRSALAYSMSADETLLEGSERNGVLIPSGCRKGSCSTCAMKLISGNVRMDPDTALNGELQSQGYILPCVSRPLSDIVLDA